MMRPKDKNANDIPLLEQLFRLNQRVGGGGG